MTPAPMTTIVIGRLPPARQSRSTPFTSAPVARADQAARPALPSGPGHPGFPVGSAPVTGTESKTPHLGAPESQVHPALAGAPELWSPELSFGAPARPSADAPSGRPAARRRRPGL